MLNGSFSFRLIKYLIQIYMFTDSQQKHDLLGGCNRCNLNYVIHHIMTLIQSHSRIYTVSVILFSYSQSACRRAGPMGWYCHATLQRASNRNGDRAVRCPGYRPEQPTRKNTQRTPKENQGFPQETSGFVIP